MNMRFCKKWKLSTFHGQGSGLTTLDMSFKAKQGLGGAVNQIFAIDRHHSKTIFAASLASNKNMNQKARNISCVPISFKSTGKFD